MNSLNYHIPDLNGDQKESSNWKIELIFKDWHGTIKIMAPLIKIEAAFKMAGV